MKIKSILLIAFILLLTDTQAQRKLLVEINSIKTKEVIGFKYDNKNQLVYFDEKGTVTYTEYMLKYDKTSKLIECVSNQDRGDLIIHHKYQKMESGEISEMRIRSGKKIGSKSVDTNPLILDLHNRLIEVKYEDGRTWENFEYDDNNNLSKYILYSASGKEELKTVWKFDSTKSPFSNISNLPYWFWSSQIDKIKWSKDFIGENNAIENEIEDIVLGFDIIEITYEFDKDGYPLKQFYNGELVKEFKYKSINE